MLNKQRCGKPGTPKGGKKEPSKAGNGVDSKGDKYGMEYKPVSQDPEWQGKGKQVDWVK